MNEFFYFYYIIFFSVIQPHLQKIYKQKIKKLAKQLKEFTKNTLTIVFGFGIMKPEFLNENIHCVKIISPSKLL